MRPLAVLVVLAAWVSSPSCAGPSARKQLSGLCLLYGSPVDVSARRLDGEGSVDLIAYRSDPDVNYYYYPYLVDERTVLVETHRALLSSPKRPSKGSRLVLHSILDGDQIPGPEGYAPRFLPDRDAVLYFSYTTALDRESLILAPMDELDHATVLVSMFPSPTPVRLWRGHRTAPVLLTEQRFAFSDRWGQVWEIDLDNGNVRDLQINGCDPLGYLEATDDLICRRREDWHLLQINLASGEEDDHSVQVGSGAVVVPDEEWVLYSDLARWVLPERRDLFAYDLKTRKRKRVVKGVDLRSGEIVPCDVLHPTIQAGLE